MFAASKELLINKDRRLRGKGKTATPERVISLSYKRGKADTARWKERCVIEGSGLEFHSSQFSDFYLGKIPMKVSRRGLEV